MFTPAYDLIMYVTFSCHHYCILEWLYVVWLCVGAVVRRCRLPPASDGSGRVAVYLLCICVDK
jgi:hypothetical protein